MTNYELVIFHKVTKNKVWLRHTAEDNAKSPIGARAAQISYRYPWVKVAVVCDGNIISIWENGKCVWDEWDDLFKDEDED